MTAYYNEIDPYAAQWLRNLADAGHVAPGHIDDRSIADVEAQDIGDGQAHFFAGIGGWSYALRLAGVPDDAPVWTGSCPCQPFSVIGRGRGADDERHLWPVWYRLIAERRPPIVFGEQVAGAAGRRWLRGVRDDMEAAGYAVGAAELPAASVGAPHPRHRIYWCASRMGHADRITAGRVLDRAARSEAAHVGARDCSGRIGHAAGAPDPVDWSDGIRWVECGDGFLRPAVAGIHLLVDGGAVALAQLRALGNAIVPQLAAAFIVSALEAIQEAT